MNADTTLTLTNAANENLRSAFAALAAHIQGGTSRPFGPLTAVSSGIPVSLFNRVFALDTAPGEELAATLDWLEKCGDPFWVTATDETLGDVEKHAAGHGLARAAIGPQPGMVMKSLKEIPPRRSEADIAAATDREGLTDLNTLTAEVFGLPLEVVQQAYPESLLSDDEVGLFMAYAEGQPVGCGMLVQTGDIAGVYNVGVAEEFRRRGIGEDLTWEVLRAGREAGCRIGVLQSSEVAIPLYRKMGFETVTRYHYFEPEA